MCTSFLRAAIHERLDSCNFSLVEELRTLWWIPPRRLPNLFLSVAGQCRHLLCDKQETPADNATAHGRLDGDKEEEHEEPIKTTYKRRALFLDQCCVDFFLSRMNISFFDSFLSNVSHQCPTAIHFKVSTHWPLSTNNQVGCLSL